MLISEGAGGEWVAGAVEGEIRGGRESVRRVVFLSLSVVVLLIFRESEVYCPHCHDRSGHVMRVCNDGLSYKSVSVCVPRVRTKTRDDGFAAIMAANTC